MKKILAVDDDKTILESIKIALQDEGYSLCCATDAATLRKKIIDCHPNVVLLDIRLGRDDGARLAREIKHDKHTRNIPVVLISANYDGAEITKKVGANAFLPKPFDVRELYHVVKKYA